MAQTVEDSNVLRILQDITKQQLHAKALIQDIQDSVEDEQELEAIHREVKKAMQAIKASIEELVILAKEQDRGPEASVILSYIENHRQELAGLQGSLRKSSLVAQIALVKRAREALFSDGNNDITVKKRVKKDKESLVKMSSDITSNLMAISRNLSDQVLQSEDTLQTLE